ncbi:MAG: hypothetical protein IPL12_21025 [Bacteroidetes bacterium]|nr:hypothetical protein [Bacteroidota bacterium]
MDVTTEFLPFGTGQTFRATDLGIGLSLARELTDQFSFGVTAKYIREDLASVHNQNLIFDFGFQYDIEFKTHDSLLQLQILDLIPSRAAKLQC